MPLGTDVGLGPDDIVLDGDPALPPQFSSHFYCGQTAGYLQGGARDVNGRDRDEAETLAIFVETRPRRDVDTSRDRLETETSRPRLQPWIP